MSRTVAALILTISLVAGQGGLVGFNLGVPMSAHMFSVRGNVSSGEERRDVPSSPRGGCCQMACTQTLCIPEGYALVHDVQPAARLMPSNENDPHSAIVWRDPPVPRVLAS